MSLDDIIKSNRKKGASFKTNRKPTAAFNKSSPTKKFGVIKGRGGRGGITRSKYTRVS